VKNWPVELFSRLLLEIGEMSMETPRGFGWRLAKIREYRDLSGKYVSKTMTFCRE
jgi:hypothetical protein